MTFLHGADLFFFFFHTALIFFNLLGWIPRKTRRLNLFSLLLTGFSWFFLGIWHGFGYCPCTEWHYQVRYRLGLFDMPDSYIDFLLQKLFSLHFPAGLVDVFTLGFFLLALFASLYFNLKKN